MGLLCLFANGAVLASGFFRAMRDGYANEEIVSKVNFHSRGVTMMITVIWKNFELDFGKARPEQSSVNTPLMTFCFEKTW